MNPFADPLRLDPLFEFAKAHLGIITRSFLWCYTVENHRKDCPYAGIYLPKSREIVFNGEPSWTTVFHECVHYRQHEREGSAFPAVYENARAELRTDLLAQGAPEDMVERLAYERCPYEVEAREKSYEMAAVYRNGIAGLGSWMHLSRIAS